MSLTKVSYSMITGAVTNILDYGADPTGVADSTAAFNAALLVATNLYVPAGIYSVTSIVHPERKVHITGDGVENTSIQGSGAIVLRYGPASGAGTFGSGNSSITGLQIKATAGNKALHINNNGVQLTNVDCRGGAIGIEINTMVGANWNNVNGYGTTYGFYFKRYVSANYCWWNSFTNCLAVDETFTFGVSTGIGFYVKDDTAGLGFLTKCTFTQLDAEKNGTGIYLDGQSVYDCVFINTWVEGANDYYIYEGSGCRNFWFSIYTNAAGGAAPTNGIAFSESSYLMSTTSTLTIIPYFQLIWPSGSYFLNGPSVGHIFDTNVRSYSASEATRYYVRTLDSAETSYAAREYLCSSFTINNDVNATGVKFSSYGAGTLTTSASGVISATSDARAKIADGLVEGATDKVMALVPRYFYWKDSYGISDLEKGRQLGFFAQEVQEAIGKEAAPDPLGDKMMGFYDRAVLATLVSAFQALNAKFETYVASHP